MNDEKEKLKTQLQDEYPIVYEWHDGPNVEYEEHEHQGRVSFYVVEGSVTFMDGIDRTVSAGERFDVPPKVKHSAKVGPEGCTYIVGQEIEGDA
ncbi:hypothetical protein KC929_00045 [Patescibacteria group bacterium]|nr:hypothetical protein [Patescibacteria group bacterium]